MQPLDYRLHDIRPDAEIDLARDEVGAFRTLSGTHLATTSQQRRVFVRIQPRSVKVSHIT